MVIRKSKTMNKALKKRQAKLADRAKACKSVKIIVVRGRTCSCKKIKTQLKLVRKERRVLRKRVKAARISRRIAKCQKAGINAELTLKSGKKCSCSAKNVKRMRRSIKKLAAERRRTENSARKLELRSRRQRARTLRTRAAACKEAGNYILVDKR